MRMRAILAQLLNSEDLESLDAAELREMLAELDDQFVDSEDVVEVSIPS
jgi:hypothetical protein